MCDTLYPTCIQRFAGVTVTVSAADGRTFGPAEDSVFAVIDTMVEPEEPKYRLHVTAKEIWGRNLDGVNPEATKAAMDATVVNTKEEAESLLEQGTRRPKTTDEIKEVRRKLALRLKKRFPEAFQNGDRAILPATKMPTSDFTTAAAATKSGITNPFGAAAKQIDSILKQLAEGLELRRQLLEVSSSELHHQLDELRSAIGDCASPETLANTLTGLKADLAMLEVVSHEVLMLPVAMVADRFIDLDKQQKKANQGNLLPSAMLTQATAAGLSISVSPGSQKYLGSGSQNTRTKTDGDRSTRFQTPGSKPKSGGKSRREAQQKRKRATDSSDKEGWIRRQNNQPPEKTGAPTPGKKTGNVPGSNKDGTPNGGTPPVSTPAGGGKKPQRNQQPPSTRKHKGGKK